MSIEVRNKIDSGNGLNDIAAKCGCKDPSSRNIFRDCLVAKYKEDSAKGTCAWATKDPDNANSLWLRYEKGGKNEIPRRYVEYAINKVTTGREFAASGYKIQEYDTERNFFVAVLPNKRLVVLSKNIDTTGHPEFCFRTPYTDIQFESGGIMDPYHTQAYLDAKFIFGEDGVVSSLTLRNKGSNRYNASIACDNGLINVDYDGSRYSFRSSKGVELTCNLDDVPDIDSFFDEKNKLNSNLITRASKATIKTLT